MTGCLVSIDPGLRYVGLAVWRAGKLASVQLVRCDDGEGAHQWRAMADALLEVTPDDVEAVCVELMRYRSGKPEAADRVIGLAYVTGIYLGGLAEGVALSTADPHVWTAGLDKEKNQGRIARRLAPEELAIVEAACKHTLVSNRKELWDAVGVGLFHLKRL